MLERLVAGLLLWGMRIGLAWFVAYECASLVEKKLSEVTRALGALGRLGGI